MGLPLSLSVEERWTGVAPLFFNGNGDKITETVMKMTSSDEIKAYLDSVVGI